MSRFEALGSPDRGRLTALYARTITLLTRNKPPQTLTPLAIIVSGLQGAPARFP